MADLSTVSPLGGALQGASQVFNPGVIMGVMKEKRDQELAPLQKQALQNQVGASGLALKQAQEEADFNSRPWNPEQSPILSMLPPDEGKMYIQRAKEMNPSGKLTNLDKKRFESNIGVDKQITDWATTAVKTKSDIGLRDAWKAMQDNPNDPVAKQNYERAYQDRAVAYGEIEKLQTKATITSMDSDPKFKETLAKYPALGFDFELAKKTGDPKALQSLLQKVTELQTTQTTAVAMEAGRNARSKDTITAADKRAAESNKTRLTAAGMAAAEAAKRAAKPQQSQFINPDTGIPYIFDPATNSYKPAQVEGAGAVAPRLVNPSAGEREKGAQLETIRDQLNRIKSEYKSRYVGLVAGRVGAVTQFTDEDEAAFRQVISDVKDSLLRARSGAQINEQEYKRLSKLVPDFTDSEPQFAGKMKSFETTFNTIVSEREKAQKKGGVYIRKTGEPAPANQPPALPATDSNGWVLQEDANGNRAYVGPNNEVREVR